MKLMHRERLETLRAQYPPECMVELVRMDDSQAPPSGTKGKVLFVDDIGTIHVAWDNGSTLGVLPEKDVIRKL